MEMIYDKGNDTGIFPSMISESFLLHTVNSILVTFFYSIRFRSLLISDKL